MKVGKTRAELANQTSIAALSDLATRLTLERAMGDCFILPPMAVVGEFIEGSKESTADYLILIYDIRFEELHRFGTSKFIIPQYLLRPGMLARFHALPRVILAARRCSGLSHYFGSADAGDFSSRLS